MTIVSINPATGESLAEYQEMTPAEVKSIIASVHEAFGQWRRTGFARRAALMKKAAAILRDRAPEYAKLMTQEMGKPIRDSRAEVEKCAWVCDYYADKAETFLQREPVATDAGKSFITYQPLGVVLAVMPWNFPFWQVFRFAAPALMAGNVGILKHASNIPACALAIEEVFKQAGFPANVFRTLLVGSRQVDAILENPLVKAATLTGSAPAGRAVAKKAGEMLKKTVLELGGSDPYLILEDADLDLAVTTCVNSRLFNSGQSCIAAKRFIVVEPLQAEFEKRFVEKMSSVKMGDPLEEDTVVGPQARHNLRDELHRQVLQSIEAGAKCLLGGTIPDNPGAFYPPTVLTKSKKAARLMMTNSSDRWRRLSGSRMKPKRFKWPMIRSLAWARRYLPGIWRAANGLRRRSLKPAAAL